MTFEYKLVMIGDKTNAHFFLNRAGTPSGPPPPIHVFKLIDPNSLKTSIEFIFTVLREG